MSINLFHHLNLRPDNPLTLEAFTEQLREREVHFLPDKTLPLNEVRVDEDLNLIIPGEGRRFALNSHSKGQLNSILGFKADRWFEGADTDVKQQELNIRLQRARTDVKFRLTDTVLEGSSANGTIAGIVTPGFQPISDAVVSGVLGFSMPRDSKILRASITEQTAEWVIALGGPIGIPSVGDTFQALSISNSNTGAASFTMRAMFLRIACKNGLVVPAFSASGKSASLLISRKHTGNALEEVLDRVHDAVGISSERFSEGQSRLAHAADDTVNDPLLALQTIVRNAHQPKKLAQEFLQSSFANEPLTTRLGIIRAVTDNSTHEAMGLSFEARRDLEQAASNYLALPC